jgi:hypothetical protein
MVNRFNTRFDMIMHYASCLWGFEEKGSIAENQIPRYPFSHAYGRIKYEGHLRPALGVLQGESTCYTAEQ